MLIKTFIKDSCPNLRMKNGKYKPKYEQEVELISEEEFIEKFHGFFSRRKKSSLVDEHQLIEKWTKKGALWFNSNQLEDFKLLFYHWYERRYKTNVINRDVVINLNQYFVADYLTNNTYTNKVAKELYTREEIKSLLEVKMEECFMSNRFLGYTIYYEQYHDFFPNIEQFTFEEIQQEKFLKYLLELFPKTVEIRYLNKINLLRFSYEELDEYNDDFLFFNFHRNNTHNPIHYIKPGIPCYSPAKILNPNERKKGLDYISRREVQNLIRTNKGLPKVGEGWISETKLYYKVKNELTDYEVINHARTPWLGAQHLDVYLPELNIGVEYQGAQHQKPIEHFGGLEAFEKGLIRDKKKRVLCEENNCKLFYVYPEDDINEFVITLKEYIKTRMSNDL